MLPWTAVPMDSWMWVRRLRVEKRSLVTRRSSSQVHHYDQPAWEYVSQRLLLLLLLVFITRYLHPSCLATLEWIWSARQSTINNLPTVIIRVPFSSKGVNHMAYLAHVTQLYGVCYCLSNSCVIVFRLSATVPRPTEAAPPYFTSRSTETTL